MLREKLPVSGGRAHTPRWRWTPATLYLVLIVATSLALVAGMAAGSAGWSLSDTTTVIWGIRAPRTFGSFLVGALLGLSGAIAQGIFRNPLAEPYLLGSASGATLAVVIVLTGGSMLGWSAGWQSPMGWAQIGVVGAAFVGAMGGIVLTLALARGAAQTSVLLLAGVVVGVLLGAIANVMLMLAPEAMRGAQVFMLGNTSFLGWPGVAALAGALVVALPLSMRFGRALDALVLGEDTAASLGVAVPSIRLLFVALLALCTGAAVAEAGLVAFVGLAAPHLVRRSVVVPHTPLLGLSALTGGLLLLCADILARTIIAPMELPVGLLTAVVGGLYLVTLLHRRAGGGAG